MAIWQSVDLYEWNRDTKTGLYLRVTALPVTITLDTALPVAVYEPSTRDEPVNSVTSATFTQTVGAGVQVLVIG